MSPGFSPGANPHGPPPVLLSGVGPVMTKIAGEVADGLIIGPLTPPRFIRDVVLGTLAEGRAQSERQSFQVCAMPFVATGRDQAELDRQIESTRATLAFYASTPTYAPVLAYFGLEGVQQRLIELSRRRDWDAMPPVITDELLDLFAVVEPTGGVIAELRQRYAGIVDRVTLHAADNVPVELIADVFATRVPA
jgi:probable F420-dependent oxidoreductase